MIDPGRYIGKAVDAQLGFTQAGNEQIAVQFALKLPSGQPYSLTWYGYFTEKTTARTLESLRHCGWHGTDISALDTGNLDMLMPNEVELVVEHEASQKEPGKFFARVRWVNPIGGGALQLADRMSEAQRIAFAERLKGQLVAMDQQQTAAPAPAARPQHTTQRYAPSAHERAKANGFQREPGDDDNIPF